MGLEDVKKGLEKQLKKECAAIEKETAQQRQELLDAAQEEIDAYKKRVEQEVEQEVAVLERRELAGAKLTAKKTLLKAKKELVDKAFSEALKELASKPEKERKARLETLVKHASQDLDVHTLYVAEQDTTLLAGYEVRAAKITGGVICENADGTQRIDLSNETLLAHVREQYLKEVAKALF